MPGATINVSAASGVTGAGYSARPDLLFAEVAEDFRAYAVGNEHRHLAEMRAVTQELGGRNNDILFTPHLLPVARGILATITVPIEEHTEDPSLLWKDCYSGEPFIEMADRPPGVRDVRDSNMCRIHAVADGHTGKLLVFAAVDNLWKGTSSQAVQNLNLMFGLDERSGIG